MLSIHEKFPKASLPLLLFLLLALLQWPSSYLIQNISLSAGIVLNEWIFLAGLPLMITWRRQFSLAQLFPFKKPSGRSLLYLALMTLSLVVLIDYLTFLSEQIWSPPPAVKLLFEKIMQVDSVGEGISRWLLICLTPALCEEFFFRGFFQKTLSRHWGKNLGLSVTAIAFMLIHGIPWYWHLYLVLGFFLGWLMLQSNNLWFPIAAHLINNTWTFANHLLKNEIPKSEIWHPVDNLVMIFCLFVFASAAKAYSRSFSPRQ